MWSKPPDDENGNENAIEKRVDEQYNGCARAL